MLSSATPTVVLGAAANEPGGPGSLATALAVGAIVVLVWQLWRARRHYALELADQSRLIAEEREKANRLLQEKEAVARESQAKSEMLATLSRETRAHLNGIIGSADLMLDASLRPPQREHLTTLRASAESLHQSLNDVLDYSSIDTGRIQLARAPFDLRQPLIEVVESLSPLAVLKGLELVLIVAPDAPVQVTGDADRLRQILLNLMANAVKFTASGRVGLRAELTQGAAEVPPAGAQWLRFAVSDTGAGIPEEAQATIFDRSVQSDATSPRQFGGSGLELAISKRLVELMGGRIGARSLPEGGSEFWVMLALPVDKTPPSATAALPAGLHVVVLDDQPAARLAVSAMLARLGVDHDATDTVAKAAVLLHDALEEEARELVLLLDESVARENGGALAGLLAADSPLRSTRIVLLSLDPEDPAAPEPKFAVTAVVRKPLLRADVLVQALSVKTGPVAVQISSSRTPFEVRGAAPPAVRRGPRVLVVDDDAISRSVSSQLLEHLGCRVELAVSGTDAIELTKTTRFELILMDLQMPVLDGYATTGKILAAAGGKAPPIVALTANTSDADREKCFAAGMCDFIGKPVHKTDLARILKRWVPAETTAAK